MRDGNPKHDKQRRPFPSVRDEAAERVLRELRELVRLSPRSQRSIEQQNDFQRGYLSQVLQGQITLSVRHLLGILRALDIAPSQFFAAFEDAHEPAAASVVLELRERMARYDAAFEQLAAKGLLDADSDPKAS